VWDKLTSDDLDWLKAFKKKDLKWGPGGSKYKAGYKRSLTDPSGRYYFQQEIAQHIETEGNHTLLYMITEFFLKLDGNEGTALLNPEVT